MDRTPETTSARPRAVEIAERLTAFVLDRFPLAGPGPLAADAPLLDNGVIDSLGLLEVVEFLETEFDIVVTDDDMVSDVFHSIATIRAFVRQRLADRGAR